MELLEGETLQRRISGSPLPNRQILDISIQLADALEAAHSKSILHRDITPSNIVLTHRNQAKIVDFGLPREMHLEAAAETAARPPPGPLPQASLTTPPRTIHPL